MAGLVNRKECFRYLLVVLSGAACGVFAVAFAGQCIKDPIYLLTFTLVTFSAGWVGRSAMDV